jgi:hypothetical protein
VRDEVTVRGRSNFLIGLFIGLMLLVFAAIPIGSTAIRAAWVVLMFGLIALVNIRAVRMGVTARPGGLEVRNLGRDYLIRWNELTMIEAARSDNITGFVTTIVIHRVDGTALVARGASSYSRRAVERWRDELVSAWPGHA